MVCSNLVTVADPAIDAALRYDGAQVSQAQRRPNFIRPTYEVHVLNTIAYTMSCRLASYLCRVASYFGLRL